MLYYKNMMTLIVLQMYAVAFVTLVYVLVKLVRAEKLRFRDKNIPPLEDIPTVSVCIAARNEMHAMTDCLESVLASTYPKLEILVLDDNSTDETSHIVRAFAHAGVRFIAGKDLPDDWLGRNFALETLLEESSGKYVLFLDVDARLKPETIDLLMRQRAMDDVAMMTVVPQRADMWRQSTWFGTLRYFWEIIFHSQRSPGVSSSAWLIDSHVLRDKLGGLSRWRDMVQPEQSIARALTASDYRLVISTADLGLTYEKKWLSQIEASRRVLLPRFDNSTTNAAVGAGLLAVIVLPQVVVILSLIGGWSVQFWGAVVVGVMSLVCGALYYRLVWTHGWMLSPITATYVAWQELFVLLSSIEGYHRGTVIWKDRPISRPER